MKAKFNSTREQSNRLVFDTGMNPEIGLHFHSQLEIMMVDRGEVEVWVNERRECLKTGEISVALSYDAHGYRSLSPTEVTFMILPTDYCKDFLQETRHKRLRNPFIRDPEIYKELKTCYRAVKDSENPLKLRGNIYVVLGILLEQMDLEDRSREIDLTLSTRMLFYINEHFREELTLRKMASDLGFNPSYLSRYFKSCFNFGFNQYLNMLRLRESILLMQEGKKEISVCAFESGFNSLRTFYRVFDKEFQCSPKEYIRGLRLSAGNDF